MKAMRQYIARIEPDSLNVQFSNASAKSGEITLIVPVGIETEELLRRLKVLNSIVDRDHARVRKEARND